MFHVKRPASFPDSRPLRSLVELNRARRRPRHGREHGAKPSLGDGNGVQLWRGARPGAGSPDGASPPSRRESAGPDRLRRIVGRPSVGSTRLRTPPPCFAGESVVSRETRKRRRGPAAVARCCRVARNGPSAPGRARPTTSMLHAAPKTLPPWPVHDRQCRSFALTQNIQGATGVDSFSRNEGAPP